MKNFTKCFRDKFPNSLLVYPCIPGVGDKNGIWLFLASFACLAVFFIIKILYRNNLLISSFINEDDWIPYYFIALHAVIMSIIMTLFIVGKLKQDKIKKAIPIFLNSFGISILMFFSSIISIKTYDLAVFLPIIGRILLVIRYLAERFIGVNGSKVLVGWWGITFSWILSIIPIIGPILGSFLTIIPQNFFLLWIGYVVLCSIYT